MFESVNCVRRDVSLKNINIIIKSAMHKILERYSLRKSQEKSTYTGCSRGGATDSPPIKFANYKPQTVKLG